MEIKTKYNIGDKVWVLYNKTPHCITIETVITNTSKFHATKISYVSMERFTEFLPLSEEPIHNQAHFSEDTVFPTKEELLKSL